MVRPARILSALVTFAAIAGLPAISPALSAQTNATRRGESALPRGYGDLNFAVSQPIGDFSNFIGTGYGLTGGFVWNLDRDRVFGIRAEGGFVQYGSETIGGCLVSCRVPVDVTTTNDIAFGGIGPQISVPAGPFRPYVNATAGFTYFFTHSSINDSDEYDYGAYDHTNHDDVRGDRWWWRAHPAVHADDSGASGPRRDGPPERPGELSPQGEHQGPPGWEHRDQSNPKRRELRHLSHRSLDRHTNGTLGRAVGASLGAESGRRAVGCARWVCPLDPAR
jgi:hypothetical protein